MSRERAKLRVKLTCGCTVRARSFPWPRQFFGCDSGLGHGYRLHWTECTDEKGIAWSNKKM